MAILEVEHLKKTYTTRLGSNRVEALKDVNFTVERGEFVAIMGESGSGKTTLLNLLAALDKPTGGQVRLNGKNLGELKEKEIAGFRRENLGFVFQDFNLLDTFSLRDNIYLPLVLEGKKYEEMSLRAEPIAKKLGITQILNKYPYEVSGGQKQRAAVARALITNPELVLADEPSSARFPCSGWPHETVRGDQRGGPDDCYGNAQCEGGLLGEACAVHQGWRGLPPAVSRFFRAR